jgi:hypothetical protein
MNKTFRDNESKSTVFLPVEALRTSKSTVFLPVEALHTAQCETQRLCQ